MKSRIILIFVALLCGCITSRPNYDEWNLRLVGKWKLVQSESFKYPALIITNGGIIIDCTADTVFGFKWELKNKKLILLNKGKNYINPIKKLTKDTLVFNSFFTEKTIQIYVKK